MIDNSNGNRDLKNHITNEFLVNDFVVFHK